MAQPNFEVISDMTILYPRDFELADPTILTSALNPLIDGEWLRVITSSSILKAERPSGSGVETNPVVGPWWGERGRYDVFAFPRKAVPLLWLYDFEAYTRVCDTTGLTTVGQKLSVTDVTVDGIANRRGLKLTAAGANTLYVGLYLGAGRKPGEIRFKRIEPTFTVV